MLEILKKLNEEGENGVLIGRNALNFHHNRQMNDRGAFRTGDYDFTCPNVDAANKCRAILEAAGFKKDEGTFIHDELGMIDVVLADPNFPTDTVVSGYFNLPGLRPLWDARENKEGILIPSVESIIQNKLLYLRENEGKDARTIGLYFELYPERLGNTLRSISLHENSDERDKMRFSLYESVAYDKTLKIQVEQEIMNELDHDRQNEINIDNDQIQKGGTKETVNEAEQKRVTAAFHNERTHTMTATPTEARTTNDPNRAFFESLSKNIAANIDTMNGLLPNQALPFNPSTGRRYSGINMVALASANRPDNRWLTFSQINEAGGRVNKGEKGTLIQVWSLTEKGPDGETVQLDKAKLSYATVFNVAQTSLTDYQGKKPEQTMTPEQFIESSGAKIAFDENPAGHPRYDRETDTITLPMQNRFPDTASYQRVAIEQIVNRQETRHANEEPPTPGSPDAALRDMKIKIAAAMIGDSLGIGHTSDTNHGRYAQHWKRAAANHPRAIVKAVADANTLAYTITSHVQQIAQSREHDMHDEHNTPRPEPQPIQQRMNLFVPFAQKDAAKEAGCRWDKDMKTWYAPAGTDANAVSQWRENRQIQATNPREELQNALLKFGITEMGNHPIMDGKPHRFPVQGDQPHEQSGYYKVYGDGVPAGFITNHRTKEQSKWKASGYELTPEMKATLARTASEKYALREEEITKKQQTTANKIEKNLAKMSPVTEKTPYMEAKGIGVENGVYLTTPDKSGQQKIAVPLTDINGKVWSLATIADDGQKAYAKDGKKHGSFHVVGGIDSLKQADAIVMAEGYATAVTLKTALQTPVVAAMDAGNLLPVAQEMRKAFPEKAIVICGDDDKKSLNNPEIGKNIGKEKALEAINSVGGQAVFPIFPKEADQNLSDFNDLANKTNLKLEGVKGQVMPALTRAVSRMKEYISKVLIRESAQDRTERESQAAEQQRQVEDKKDIEKFIALPEKEQPYGLEGADENKRREFYASLEGREYRAVNNKHELDQSHYGLDFADREREVYYETKYVRESVGSRMDVLNHVYKLDPQLARDMAPTIEAGEPKELADAKKPEMEKVLGIVQNGDRKAIAGIDFADNSMSVRGDNYTAYPTPPGAAEGVSAWVQINEHEAGLVMDKINRQKGSDLSDLQCVQDTCRDFLAVRTDYELNHKGTYLRPGMSHAAKTEILQNYAGEATRSPSEIQSLNDYLFKTMPEMEALHEKKQKVIEMYDERKRIVENLPSMNRSQQDNAIDGFQKKYGETALQPLLREADQKMTEVKVMKEWPNLSPEKRTELMEGVARTCGPYVADKLERQAQAQEKGQTHEKAEDKEKEQKQEKPKAKAKGVSR